MAVTTYNPSNGKEVKTYEHMSSEMIDEKLALAQQGFAKWKTLPTKQRAEYLLKLAAVLREGKEEYATLIATEMGMPLRFARKSVEKCAWTAEVYAERGLEWLADEVVEADGKKHLVTYDPLGVLLFIMPWNFPFWQVFRVAIPTLLAGNTALLKHASQTTGAGLIIEEIFTKAGFPQGVFQTIVADHASVARVMQDPRVRGVSLTGSVPAGKRVAEAAGKELKPVVLELGGSDPFIVLADADLDLVAKKIVAGRLYNSGQVCISPKRIIAVSEVFKELEQKILEQIPSLKVGDALREETDMGPLASERAVTEMEEIVTKAKAEGAELLYGGEKIDGEGYFFSPTFFSKVTEEMDLFKEETFGPIIALIEAKDETDAIRLANNSQFGLGASVWTRDLEKAEAVCRKIDAGSTFVNSLVKTDPRLPVGGIKNSGLGRELSKYVLYEFTNVKSINVYEHNE